MAAALGRTAAEPSSRDMIQGRKEETRWTGGATPAKASKAGRRWALRAGPRAPRPRATSAKEFLPSLQKDVQMELDDDVNLMIIEDEADEITTVRETTHVRIAMDSEP